ncbi:outer membrane lipoprotein SlyB [Massilia sp. MP_M2]|uniref:glycine zipper 2TM domain-containing protein n=1 Tax=Massilia sp. MP_M2 TaxID=3071713 RepID=UPI00319DA2C9
MNNKICHGTFNMYSFCRSLRVAAVGIFVCFSAACATPVYTLPVRTASIVDVHPTQRVIAAPNAGGALIGALLGGVAGNQVGKGRGKKVATLLGAVAGAAAGAGVNAQRNTVPASYLLMRDDQSGEFFNVTLDGVWQTGMKVRYSNRDGGFVLR